MLARAGARRWHRRAFSRTCAAAGTRRLGQTLRSQRVRSRPAPYLRFRRIRSSLPLHPFPCGANASGGDAWPKFRATQFRSRIRRPMARPVPAFLRFPPRQAPATARVRRLGRRREPGASAVRWAGSRKQGSEGVLRRAHARCGAPSLLHGAGSVRAAHARCGGILRRYGAGAVDADLRGVGALRRRIRPQREPGRALRPWLLRWRQGP